MDGYDEDLLINPFYKALSTKGKHIYQNATNNRWMICIPRKGTTSRSQHNKEQFESHILKPQGENSNVYLTVNNKEVKINGSFIITTKGFSDVKSIQILFEETFFNQNEESYHVLCIDQLFDGGAFASHVQPVIQNLETLQNCIDFLWSGTGSKRARNQINGIIELFNSTYTRLASESVRHTLDAANAVFTRAMQTCLKESHLRRPAMSNKSFMDNLKIACETYVMDGMYKKVFKGINSFLADEDAAFNKTTRNLTDLQVKDLGININLCKNIPKAKKVLSNLNKFTTPLEKLYVLKLTVMSMTESSKLKKEDDTNPITADDLLPALVFLVVKSEIPNWLGNLTYMQNFHFSRCKMDEFQFYLSSTEAAIEHVRTGHLDGMISMTHTQRLKMVNSLFQRMDASDKFCGPSPVDVFFEHVRSHRTKEVMKMLNESVTTMKEITESMCHPLCSCDTCEKLLASKRKDPSAVTVFSRDDLGCTALHQAAEFGCEEIIYELIKKGAVINATNYHGSTPLHQACQRGHRKATVILKHYQADINYTDNGGNTPLHLAVANGHEACSDFLCSSGCEANFTHKLNINAANENDDTALHIASRWGFSSLVFLLLKNGASSEIINKNGNTPWQCALNQKIQQLFLQGANEESREEGYIYLQDTNNVPSTFIKTGYITPDSPNTSRRKREFTKLLRAVADGGTEYVRHKLGIPIDSDAPEDPDTGPMEDLLCHPLCQCEKCYKLQKKTVSEAVTLNVNMVNQDGVCALHVAALHGYEQIVSLLLKRGGAQPNMKTKSNCRTPLHLACQYNNVECVSLLLKHGARTSVKDASGNTPLHFCCTNGHIGPAILLMQSGSNVHCVNQRGNTPLHDAARWNYVDLTRLLLYYDAPVNARNKMHMTPFHYARDEKIQSLLQEAERKLFFTNENDSSPKRKAYKAVFTEDISGDQKLFESSTETKVLTEVLSVSSHQTNTSINFINSESSVNNETENCLNDQNKTKTNVKIDGKYTAYEKTDKQGEATVADLFHAFEEDNLVRVKQITQGIKRFDRRKRLRKVTTNDRSFTYLNNHVTLLSIRKFDLSNLNHVEKEKEEEEEIVSDDELFADCFGGNSVLQNTHATNDTIDNKQLFFDNTENTESTKTADCSEDMSDVSVLESRQVGSADDVFDYKSDKNSTHELSVSAETRNSSIHTQKEESPQFEDWYVNEISAESADHLIEGSHIVDESLHDESRNDDAHSGIITNERITKLLNEAIDDDDGDDDDNYRTVRTPTGISKTLKDDDTLFT